MAAPLRLHLVLDMHACDASADVLSDCARDIRGSNEAKHTVERQLWMRGGDSLPCLRIRDNRDGGLQAADHLRGLKDVG